jgi:hypothetical protein
MMMMTMMMMMMMMIVAVMKNTRMYPKVSGLATWSENYKCYSSLPLGAVVWLFCESVS